MAMTLVAVSPTAGQQQVGLGANVALRVDEPLHNVVDASVVVKFRLSPTVAITVYNGSAGGFQAGYQGGGSSYSNTAGVGVAITIDQDPGLFYETFLYTVEVDADNDNAEHLSDSYPFDTVQSEAVKNSGFEARHASVTGQARYWSDIGFDRGAQMGVKRGRLNNPAIYSPPEGDHVLGLGSADLTEPLDTIPTPVLENIPGAPSAGTSDTFNKVLSIPEGHIIVSVEVRKNGTTKVGADDGLGGIDDDGTGFALKGGISYWSGYIWVEEDGGQVWDVGDSVDVLVQTMPTTFEHILEQDIRDQDLSPYTFLRFNFHWETPATINANVTWQLRTILDDELLDSYTFTTADQGNSLTGLKVLTPVAALSGFGHTLRFILTMETTAVIATQFDGLTIKETFEAWPGTYTSEYLEAAQQPAEFDGDTQIEETFQEWHGTFTYPNGLPLVEADFNNGVDDSETFQIWRN